MSSVIDSSILHSSSSLTTSSSIMSPSFSSSCSSSNVPFNRGSGIIIDLGGWPNTSSYGIALVVSCTCVFMVSKKSKGSFAQCMYKQHYIYTYKQYEAATLTTEVYKFSALLLWQTASAPKCNELAQLHLGIVGGEAFL